MTEAGSRHARREAGIQSQGERNEGFESSSEDAAKNQRLTPWKLTLLGTGYPLPCGHDETYKLILLFLLYNYLTVGNDAEHGNLRAGVIFSQIPGSVDVVQQVHSHAHRMACADLPAETRTRDKACPAPPCSGCIPPMTGYRLPSSRDST